MPANARIAFSSFPSSYDLQFAVWRRVTERILGESPTTRSAASSMQRSSALTASALAHHVPLTAPRGIWQLLAANNRELARSTSDYSRFSEALAHIVQLKEAATLLEVRVDRQSHQRDWFWVADCDGEPVMASARVFTSASEAAKTAAGAVLAFALATIDELPRDRPARRPASASTRASSDAQRW